VANIQKQIGKIDVLVQQSKMLTPADVIYVPDKAIHGNKKSSTNNSTSPSYR
jgi:hypothetical protein